MPGPAAVSDSQQKSPSPTGEQLTSDVTPAAVLNAFHQHRLNSLSDSVQQSTQALPITAATSRTRLTAKERNGTGVHKKPGKLL